MVQTQQPLIVLADGSTRTVGSQATKNNIMAAKLLSNVLISTLGPRGMDKMLINTIGDIKITNDGYTILKETEPDHPAAKMLVDLSKMQEDDTKVLKSLFSISEIAEDTCQSFYAVLKEHRLILLICQLSRRQPPLFRKGSCPRRWQGHRASSSAPPASPSLRRSRS